MKKALLFTLLTALFSGIVFANSSSAVSSVTASLRGDGSKLVDIYYSLADTDGDACTVWASVSSDGGTTWRIPFLTSSGDLGSNVGPGSNKHIVWDAGKDILGTISTLKVRIFTDDGKGSDSLIMIEGDTYQMGDHFDVGDDDEKPVHTVQVNTFMMGKYEITNQQYCEFLNHMLSQTRIYVHSDNVVYATGDTSHSYPYLSTRQGYQYNRISRVSQTSFIVDPADKQNHPVTTVSWYGAVAYCNWRSEQHGLTPSYNTSNWTCNFNNEGFRLPTEAEWEWATRTASAVNYWKYHWGDSISGANANYNGSGDPYDTDDVADYPETTPVGYYNGSQTPSGSNMITPNGLYDMAGNVWEWCHDRHGNYPSNAQNNPTGPASGTSRVLRGGCSNTRAIHLRSAERGNGYPASRINVAGFRIVLDFN